MNDTQGRKISHYGMSIREDSGMTCPLVTEESFTFPDYYLLLLSPKSLQPPYCCYPVHFPIPRSFLVAK